MKTSYHTSKVKFVTIVLLLSVTSIGVVAKMTRQRILMVGGAPMYPTKNIIENAVNSKDHTTLVAAVKAAGLVDALSGPGPFTVFAPTNEAFAKLPAGTVESLVKPENKNTLANILTYHVIAGAIDSRSMVAAIKAGGGTATMTTVEGEPLTVKMIDGILILSSLHCASPPYPPQPAPTGPTKPKKPTRGRLQTSCQSAILLKDVYQSNGIVHVVDTVLMP